MGFPVEQFVDSKINEEFVCSICHDVLQQTTMAHPCEHTFCGKCIRDWQEQGNSDTCPIDREAISELRRPPRPFLSMLNALKIRCPFQEAGCGISVQLGDYVLHSELCEANPENRITCAGECGAVLKKANVKDHTCVAYLKGTQEQLLKANDKLLIDLQTTREELAVTKSKLETIRNAGYQGMLKLLSDIQDLSSRATCAEQQNTDMSFFGKPKPNTIRFAFKPETTQSTFGNPVTQPTDALSLGTPIKFEPLHGTDVIISNGRESPINVQHQCITTMREYNASKSIEELRWEDYQLGRINSAWLSARKFNCKPCTFPCGIVLPAPGECFKARSGTQNLESGGILLNQATFNTAIPSSFPFNI